MKKKLALKKETLSMLDNGELADIVAGTGTWTCSAGCTVTNGDSCGGVCSGYCETYTCPSKMLVDQIVSRLEGTSR